MKKQRGLSQSKVTSSLARILQKPGTDWAHNCKMHLFISLQFWVSKMFIFSVHAEENISLPCLTILGQCPSRTVTSSIAIPAELPSSMTPSITNYNKKFYVTFFPTIFFCGLTMNNEQPWVLYQPYWVVRLLIRWRVLENTDSVFIGLAFYQGQSWTSYERIVPSNTQSISMCGDTADWPAIPDKIVSTRSMFSPPPTFNVDNQVIFFPFCWKKRDIFRHWLGGDGGYVI